MTRRPNASSDAPSLLGAHQWHTLDSDEVARLLDTSASTGLTAVHATARLAKYGANELTSAPKRSALRIVAHQFRSILVLLLAVACALAFAFGDTVEALAILLVILLNASVGFVTEWQAARALEGLRQQEVQQARVRRDGADLLVPAQTLVPGDLVLIGAGDRVPADARLVQSAQFRVDESSLTGESVPSDKSPAVLTDAQAVLGDRASMLFAGTIVTEGRAEAIVVATGATTELGRIGAMIDDVQEHGTPLERKLDALNRVLMVLVLLLCCVIVLLGWLRGHALPEMVRIGVSLAIAAVPEGLLAVTTMTLAIGMQRMAKMHALVRRLPAVEALGSTTVICSDKTGTLTRNEMTVRALHVGDRHVDVAGSGYVPVGDLSENGATLVVSVNSDDALPLALRIGVLCNDSSVDRSIDPPAILGDPTEAALIVAAEKAKIDIAALREQFPRLHELPFDSDTKRMVTVHTTPDGRRVAYAKGSPAALLRMCSATIGAGVLTPLTDAGRATWTDTNNALAGQALRVLALGYRALDDKAPSTSSAVHTSLDAGTPTTGFTLVGFVAMTDPLRDGVRDTIATCRGAGIRVIMVTGDQQVTAEAIARELGLDRAPDGTPTRVVHARDLDALDDAGWEAVARDAAVLARVSPAHKMRLVRALQDRGEIVAMTGDGVNDAPALRTADIGVAMGIRGTDVAKDAADMVITDDDFTTIVRAVEQGRMIVSNILRFIHYLFSCNFAELLVVFTTVMIGWPLPLGVLQILWLNMLTDIFPALALALEPSAPGVMTRPPRDPRAPLMTWAFGGMIAWQGALLAICTLAAFRVGLNWHGDTGEGLRRAETIAFMTLAMAQIFHAFNARSTQRSIFSRDLFTNAWLWGALALCFALQAAAVYVPALRSVLDTTALSPRDVLLVTVTSLCPVLVVELYKMIQRAVRAR